MNCFVNVSVSVSDMFVLRSDRKDIKSEEIEHFIANQKITKIIGVWEFIRTIENLKDPTSGN